MILFPDTDFRLVKHTAKSPCAQDEIRYKACPRGFK